MRERPSLRWCAIEIWFRWYILDALYSFYQFWGDPKEFVRERGAIAAYWGAWMKMNQHKKDPS